MPARIPVLGVIPARYGSTRFPGKPLVRILGRPMIEWAYRSARRALSHVVVATDDARIADAVRSFGGEVEITSATCPSGTARLAEVAARRPAAFYVNVQGDAPAIDPAVIKRAIRLAKRKKEIATVAAPLRESERDNPNAVKVVCAADGRALYFSRTAIPYRADVQTGERPLKHLGLYVYPARRLREFVRKKPPVIERAERLEQLRALYYGWPIYVAAVPNESVGVDVPADLKRAEAQLRQSSYFQSMESSL